MNKLTSPDIMKLTNTKTILRLIHEEHGIYRKLIAQKVNLSSQTVTNIVKELLADDILIEKSISQQTKGRNPKALVINYKGFYALGVEVRVDAIEVVLSNLDGDMIRHECDDLKGDKDALTTLKELIDKTCHGFDQKERIQAVVISVQGIINEKTGHVIRAKELNWHHLDLRGELEYLGIPVLLRNDVNMVAHGEIDRHPSDMNFMVVKFDDGVGSSIVIDGRVMRSSNNVAGEFGHITVDHSESAKLCKCGKKGCLTTVASLEAIESDIGLPFEEIVEEVKKGNKKILEALKRINKTIGLALANVIMLLDLDRLVVTGRLMNDCKDVLYEDLCNRIDENISDWITFKDLEVREDENLACISAKLLMNQFLWDDDYQFNLIHRNLLEKD